jgi:hypothetical protein
MFSTKAGVYPNSGAPLNGRLMTLFAKITIPSLERFTKDINCSKFGPFRSCKEKCFVNIAPFSE